MTTVRFPVGLEVLELDRLWAAFRAAGAPVVRLETAVPQEVDGGLRVLVVLADDAPGDLDYVVLRLADAHLARLLPPGAWLALAVRDATMADDLEAADAVARLCDSCCV